MEPEVRNGPRFVQALPSPPDARHGRSRLDSPMTDCLLIAHRGASADRPEHTLAAYRLAVAQGADVIEPDVVPTADGALVVRHENEISGTTDVDQRPAFASRRTTKTIDGVRVTGWFTEDFALAELRTLRCRERLPDLRPGSARYDGRFQIPTLDEVLALARELGAARGRAVGVYPETKHPAYFRSLGLALEEPLADALAAHGLDGPDDPAWLQSFEPDSLQRLGALTGLRRVQLVADADAPPPGWVRAATLDAPAAFAALGWADAVGPDWSLLLDDALAPTAFAAHAHAAGLAVHAWTLRPENAFLPQALRSDTPDAPRPADHGDLVSLARAVVAAGADGVFTDAPGAVARALADLH